MRVGNPELVNNLIDNKLISRCSGLFLKIEVRDRSAATVSKKNEGIDSIGKAWGFEIKIISVESSPINFKKARVMEHFGAHVKAVVVCEVCV